MDVVLIVRMNAKVVVKTCVVLHVELDVSHHVLVNATDAVRHVVPHAKHRVLQHVVVNACLLVEVNADITAVMPA